MEAKDLRSKSSAELKQELLNVLREQFNLRMQRGSGQLSKPHQLNAARKNVARIKTILNEKTGKVS